MESLQKFPRIEYRLGSSQCLPSDKWPSFEREGFIKVKCLKEFYILQACKNMASQKGRPKKWFLQLPRNAVEVVEGGIRDRILNTAQFCFNIWHLLTDGKQEVQLMYCVLLHSPIESLRHVSN